MNCKHGPGDISSAMVVHAELLFMPYAVLKLDSSRSQNTHNTHCSHVFSANKYRLLTSCSAAK